ncbi:uncharacterized protein PHALS_11835 [Plasmopara halstedii]|uniref:Uncharacterized protein n=1 Tax=Plasmopara halstedii TaxID=4781 RepID=A0A0P1AKV6_PLAHL|nr:uncharacterized protein PHALS_11835 [Plasmopara halstedii]CEG41494.1 hypothetical protein PHALS_11835 [Plasmopara halstedii]|eukprot:XP_024577863.1 hypothetical protein PHALS_11835 [Plasmopara halstedii]
MSDHVSAASRDVTPRLDEPERRAPRTLSVTSDLVEDVVVFHYQSDTPFPRWNDEEGEPRPARDLRTPCLFPDLSSLKGRGVITNDLDKAQRRQLEDARKASLMRAHPRSVIDPRVEYGFRPTDPYVKAKDAVTRSLRAQTIGAPAISEAGLAERKGLRARFLVPQEISLDVYRTRLRAQRGGS